MTWQSTVKPVAEKVMQDKNIPGIVIAVARGHDAPEYLALGNDGAGRAMKVDTLIPVASITKLATSLVVLRLAANGTLALDAPLADYLPEAAAAKEGVTLRTLLCHTSGLPDDLAPELAPYNAELNWHILSQACLKTPLANPPKHQVLYSNVGIGLLATIVERLTRQPFRVALSELVLAPLHIDGYLGVEPPRQSAVIVGALGEHAGTSLAPYNSPFWRALGVPWGGLITTAAGTIALVQAFAGMPSDFLPRDLREDAIRDQTNGLSGGFFKPLWWSHSSWGLGVELRGDKNPHWTPTQASPISFGHAGASGCLVWHDPLADFSWTILGNRLFGSWWMRWQTIGTAIYQAVA